MYPLLFLIAVKLSGKSTFLFPFLDLPQKPQQAGAQRILVELKDSHDSLLLLLSYIKQWISTFLYSSLSRGCLFPLAVAQIWITSTVFKKQMGQGGVFIFMVRFTFFDNFMRIYWRSLVTSFLVILYHPLLWKLLSSQQVPLTFSCVCDLLSWITSCMRRGMGMVLCWMWVTCQ